jgi:hypothetical protein
LFLLGNSTFDSPRSFTSASLIKPGRTGPFRKQAILSPAGRWILPGGLFAPVLSDWRPLMVSIDHFRQELLVQLRRAATEGRIDILINSGELCRTIPGNCSWSASCCDAMQEELKSGDTLVLDRTNGAGMTIRYLLPRE